MDTSDITTVIAIVGIGGVLIGIGIAIVIILLMGLHELGKYLDG